MLLRHKDSPLKLFGGVDLHKEFLYCYIINQLGKKCDGKKVDTTEEAIRNYFAPYQGFDIEVAVEIANMTFWFCDILQTIGIKTYVVNTYGNQKLYHRKKKTDKKDARDLAWDLFRDDLPPKIYIPNQPQRQLRSLLSHRYQAVKDRVRLVNRSHAFLNRYGMKANKSSLRVNLKYWKQLLVDLKNENTFALEELQVYYLNLKNKLEEIKMLESRIALLIKTHYIFEYKRLITVPGVGPVIAASLIAYVGNWKRFKTGRQLTSYFGLSPRIRESGNKKLPGDGPITKEGIPMVRGYFVQAALVIIGSSKREAQPLRTWYENLKIRKGWKKARVALARKICEIAFAVVKNEQNFDPLLLRKNSKPAG